MRLAPALKYQLNSIKRPLIIFYIVIYSLLILTTTLQILFRDYIGDSDIGGMDLSSVIFLFVIGLNVFKSTFHMFSANGISRKTMFVSFIATTGILCSGMAIIDSINALIINQFVDYQPIMAQLFASRYSDIGIAAYGEGLLWMFFMYAASMMFGFFLTTAYYRMNKPLKLAISIGVPGLLFVILPILDTLIFHGEVYKAIGILIAFCTGQLSGSPYVAMASNVVFYAIFATLGFLLVRRATEKLSAS